MDSRDQWVELINDSSPNGVFPTTESDIERYDQVTLRMLAEKMPEYHVNPMQTRSWNMAYLQALANGADYNPTADELAQGKKLLEKFHIKKANLEDCSICHH